MTDENNEKNRILNLPLSPYLRKTLAQLSMISAKEPPTEDDESSN